MVDKIGGINPLNNVQNTRRTEKAFGNRMPSDSINVSDNAMKMAEAYYLKEVADQTPDIRTDLVEQIKQKIQDPSYLSPEKISSAADKILSSYGF